MNQLIDMEIAAACARLHRNIDRLGLIAQVEILKLSASKRDEMNLYLSWINRSLAQKRRWNAAKQKGVVK